MFRFEEPTYLYLLAALPLIAILRWVLERKQLKRLKLFGDPTLLRHLMPDVSKMRPVVKFWMLLAAMALIIVMMARPQMGTRISHEKRTGIESIIAMDISNSMLAEDVTPSRLDRTKMMVENLVDNFTDDKIGLIVFAGDAFVQLPITSDYVSAKMFLSEIEPSLIATQGTDIATAINMAANSFTQQQGVGKAIIVITDGEDHEGGALEAAKAAKKKGMRVYVLGVGSDKGAPIPLGNGDYMKDRTGNTVMTKLNEEMCRQIAEAGGGAYIHVDNNTNAQRQLDSELAKLSKKEMQSTIYSDYDEQFQAFGIIAIILLILEICILESKNPIARRLNIFGRKQRTTTLIIALVVASASFAQNDRRYITQGNKLFRNGQFDKAEVAYRKAIEKNPRNPQAHYNLGNSLMAQKKDSAAVQSFQKSTELETSKIRKAMAFHNMGVVCQQHKMYGEAIEAYKNSLRLNPKDDATRYNLELCKRQQRNQKNQDKQDQNKQKDKNGNDQKDEKQKNKDKQDQKKNNNENKMSKENAEQMLNAAMQQEKSTQQRMKKAMQKPRTNKLDKEW
ncbi:VWA domain-containing protein [Prevotella sp. P2-180]|uniref:VWA domain-containing protein n=1 Tax=Prevotella sp. P2-180 TaxID=2024224 RepID=UPI000B97807B|nr:VWA domain-containing protein [Prevotella sp. P2-180]OYP66709.1 BatB/BatC protein [Prevotella sp. P2-180]